MIFGAKNYIHRETPGFWATQTRNTVEKTYRLLITEIKKKYPDVKWSYLETCGASAAANCLIAVDKEVRITCPGGYRPQLDCMIAEFFNDPNNEKVLNSIGYNSAMIQNNRVMAAYPLAVSKVSGHQCELVELKTFKETIDYFKNGYAIQMCLKTPGHYICCILYDDEAKKIGCIDSWPERTGSHYFTIDEKEFIKNTFNSYLVYPA
jgi:hypothetical protein